MRERHLIFLVPGFFGFARLGDLMYFHYVQQALEAEWARHGLQVTVVPVETHPTASILRRGQRLLDTILSSPWEQADAIHLLGHSTGGLDARVLASPRIQLTPEHRRQQVLKKLRTIVTLSTPHHGSPIAGFFTTAYGKNLLQLLSLLTARASGEVSAGAVSLGFKLVNRFQGRLGLNDTLLNQLSEQLLEDFNGERRAALLSYTRQIREDQGALLQLTPEGMHLFNALLPPPEGIGCYSIINAAPPPKRTPPMEATVNPRVAIGYVLYRFMWDTVAEHHRAYPYAQVSAPARERLEQQLRLSLDSETSDGVVPTLSMAWGKCVGAVRGDHLDVVGHFGKPRGMTQFADWLRSGAGFGETHFIALYRQISRLMMEGEQAGMPELLD
ncbi:MAG: esterase/lipase family protein [Myxococcota bacterium]